MMDFLSFLPMPMVSELSVLSEEVLRFGSGISWHYAASIACAILFVILYTLLSRPINYVRDLTAIGFDHLTKGKGKITSRLVQVWLKQKSFQNDLPPVYPNGWIPILESRDLKKGQVKPVSAIGEEFAVFRNQEGSVFVVDAFCPHLGAHLGVGGMVKGDCIQCPFHGWTFDGSTGKCTEVPYSAKGAPSFASLKTWRSCEENGVVFVWYHAEGEPPDWTVPSIPEIREGTFTYRGRSEHTVVCHIQEIPENGADSAHLNELHYASLLTGNKPWTWGAYWRKLFTHAWSNTWEQGTEDQRHVVNITLNQDTLLVGKKIESLGFSVDLDQVGPALVILRLKTWLGRGVFVQTVTPLGPLKQKLVHLFYAEFTIPRIISSIMVIGEATQVERDVAMWNNKRLLRQPLLVSEDKTISKYRRWYTQFYTEHSPTLQDIRNKSLEW